MKNRDKRAFYTLGVLVVGLLMYHTLIITGVVSAQNVWLGRLENSEEVFQHELVSIALLGFVLIFMALNFTNRAIATAKYIYLLYAIILFLNAIADFFAQSTLELFLFTPLAFWMSYLFFNISKNKEV